MFGIRKYILPLLEPFPAMFNASFHDPVVEDNKVRLYCEIAYDDTVLMDNGARFEVSFYFDHVLHPNATVIARGDRSSAPSPQLMAMGRRPRMVVRVVIEYLL